MITTTITDPDGIPGDGGRDRDPGHARRDLCDQTWTAGASGTIDFHEATVMPPAPTAAASFSTRSSRPLRRRSSRPVPLRPRRGGRGGGPEHDHAHLSGPGVREHADPATGEPSNITINDVSHNEGDAGQTAYVFTVSLSAPQAAAVTVNFATAERHGYRTQRLHG